MSRPSPTPPAACAVPARTAPAGVGKSMVQGGAIFAVVSVLAYSIWAFRLVRGTGMMYSAIAAVYLVLAGFATSRLLPAGSLRKRFPLFFAAGFLAYAVCWCAFWFGLRGKYQADLWGAAVGLAAMTALLCRLLRCSGGFLPCSAVVFTFHTLGYALGGELYAAVGRTGGRLLWGVSHGLGFGAGLGYLLAQCPRLSPASRDEADDTPMESRPAGNA